MSQIDTPQTLTLEDLANIWLNHGGHNNPDEGHCFLEVVSMFAGEPFSAAPKCVDPVLRSFGISWNDGLRSDEERNQLKPYIPRLIGTNRGGKLSLKRSWMALDWLIRVHCAAWLALTPALAHHSEALKALGPIMSQRDLDRAMGSL
ncbi:hypothetical protein F3J20_22665, partial [Paraburkholderia sp. Cy-641]|uniref:hypothetical protein n=1 Tax=Paraburkholderia sp. Cy-641 TaxID=2608337 RepID=UPI001422DDAD